MKPERYQQVDRIFQAVLDQPTESRAAFLDQLCSGDPELKSEVNALLSSDHHARSLIESPALELAPELMGDPQSLSLIGQTIGPYRVTAHLGSGGMGDVFLAEDTRLGRSVALKLLTDSLVGDTGSRARFLREARLASALDHANICTIFEVGEAAGRCFIAMQYVEGETLKELIAGRALDLDNMLAISLQVADALRSAHDHEIIHRDIKSSNIIVTQHSEVKVLDFGLAKPLEKTPGQARDELTRTGAIIGTPAYMSPEQARGEPVDERSDIFSLGVVMYEMATGDLPFKERSQPETLNAVINLPHTPAASLNKQVSAELSGIIDRALDKKPEDRYQRVEQIIEDLRKAAESIGIVASNPSRAVTVGVGSSRRRAISWKRLAAHKPRRTSFIATLVLVASLAFGLYFFWPKKSAAPASPVSIKSIAVLPFKPLVEVGRDEALEMGMADTLISKLSNIREIVVRPISAVRKYAGLEQDSAAAGREQRVDAVLDGSIQKSAGKIRVSVRLVRVGDESPLWSGQFDEQMTDIFAVQDSISQRVVGALSLTLSGEERELLAKRYTDNNEAYQLYLIGRNYWNGRTEDTISKGIDYFNRAIEKDPNYALAFAGLSDSYSMLAFYSALPPRIAFPKAKAAATRAVEIDDTLAEAHTSLASVMSHYDWNLAGAEREFKRAIELNPNYPTAHHWYSLQLAVSGRFSEALPEARRARDLDPLSPIINSDLAQILRWAGRVDESVEQLRATIEMHPNFPFAHFLLGLAYLQKGDREAGISELHKSRHLFGGRSEELSALGHAYAISGKRDQAIKLLAEVNRMSKRQYVSPVTSAGIYVGLGDKDRVFELLEKAYQERDWRIGLLKIEPAFDSLRSDPRYTELLKRAGLAF